MRKILVAIDFSDASDKIIKAVSSFATDLSYEVFLMHIVEPSISYNVTGVLPDEAPFPMLNNEERTVVKNLALDTLKGYTAKLKALSPDIVVKEVVVDEFEAGEAIMTWAEENEMELIVLGKHGRGFFANVLIGSVAISVVKKSKVPVLVIPVAEEEQ